MAKKSKTVRKPTRAGASKRDAQAWIAAALDRLATGGIESVRVEPLAKVLSVTKGSFYWHFADRRALLDAMLQQWRDGRIAAITRQSADGGSPADILRQLAALYTQRANARGLMIELAIRAAARNDKRAARAVRSVDKERLLHVSRLFQALGWPAPRASERAVLFYSYLFGQSLLDRSVAVSPLTQAAIAEIITAP